MPKKNRSRKVNFEKKRIASSRLPKGSLFIEGMWYSSARKMPARIKGTFGRLFRILKGHNYGAGKIEADGTLIPIKVPAVDTRSIADLLSELKRIENFERQFRGFATIYWDNLEWAKLGNDENKAELYFQECAKWFWLPYATYHEFCEAKRLLEEEKNHLVTVLLKKTTWSIEENHGEHYIALQPKPMQLPRDNIDGLWHSQDAYIELCVNKGQAVNEVEMLSRLCDHREENKGRMTWAEDLTPEGYRWGKDQYGRVLKKRSRYSQPFYFGYFRDFPDTRTTTAEVEEDEGNISDNEIEWNDESRARYECIREQRNARL